MIDIQPKDTSKGHFYISMVKSVFRLVAGGALSMGFFGISGVLFVFAELLGVAEELV